MAATPMSSSAALAPCTHKPEIGCVLTAVPSCCACADKRPMATAYPVYIDGAGMKNTGRRWQKYCWKCRDYHNQQSLAASTASSQPSFDISLPQHIVSTTSESSDDSAMSQSRASRSHIGLQAQSNGQGLSHTPFNVSENNNNEHYGSQPPPRHPIQYGQDGQVLDRQDQPAHSTAPTSIQPAFGRLAIFGAEPERAQFVPRDTPSVQQTFPLGTREDVQAEDYQSPIASMFGAWYQRYSTAEEVRRSQRVMDPAAAVFNPAYGPRSNPAQPTPTQTRPQSARSGFHSQFYNSAAGPNNAGQANNALDQMPTAHQQYPTPFFQGPAGSETNPNSFSTAATTSHLSQGLQGGLQNSMYAPNPFSRPPAPPGGQFMMLHAQRYRAEEVHDGSDEIYDGFNGEGPNAIDAQERPVPLGPADMKIDISCKICGEQKMDVMTEPCNHLAMCHWCADVWRQEYRNKQRQGDTSYKFRCPLCRKPIKIMKRIHLA